LFKAFDFDGNNTVFTLFQRCFNAVSTLFNAVSTPFQRHFNAISINVSTQVEYTEFIWGIAMLFDGSLAQQFDKLWKEVDSDNTGTLDKYEV